jgi:hypothetical protein
MLFITAFSVPIRKYQIGKASGLATQAGYSITLIRILLLNKTFSFLLLVCLDGFLHLHLLAVPLLVQQLGLDSSHLSANKKKNSIKVWGLCETGSASSDA